MLEGFMYVTYFTILVVTGMFLNQLYHYWRGSSVSGKKRRVHTELDMSQVSGHICNCSLEEEDWGQTDVGQVEEEKW